jgi:uncharacterized protein YbbK (DUF523 family)
MHTRIKCLECVCHRCNYRWQYRGNSKYIACCPRCKMTIYIPKMLRLLREAQNDTICGDQCVEQVDRNTLDALPNRSCQCVEQVDRNTLDARVLISMTSSGSTHHMYDGTRHG